MNPVRNLNGKKPRPGGQAPIINRHLRFFFFPTDPWPHYASHHPKPPTQEASTELNTYQGVPRSHDHPWQSCPRLSLKSVLEAPFTSAHEFLRALLFQRSPPFRV